MNCVLIESESYEELKNKCHELQANNTELEAENESLINCNQILKRLVNALENIKFNLEQKLLLFNRNLNINEQFLPFDRDLNFWDEQYCHLKCQSNELEFNDDNHEFTTSSLVNKSFHSNQSLVIDANNHSLRQENSFIATDSQCDNYLDNSFDANHRQLINSTEKDSSHSLAIFSDNKNKNIDAIHKNCLKKVKVESQHPNDKRFKCDWNECQYRTNIKGNYVKHYRIHTGEKPFKCDFDGCQYCCSDPTQYREHKLTHSSAKAFSCDWPECDWKFKTMKNLRNHMRACHAGDRPHKCEWPGCDKGFLSPFELSYHKRRHTGDRPFSCDYPNCGQTFTRSATLLRHKRASHGTKKQFVCDFMSCESKFTRKDDLIRHVRLKHESSFDGSVIDEKKVMKKSVKRKKESTFESNSDLLTDNKIVIDMGRAKNKQAKSKKI